MDLQALRTHAPVNADLDVSFLPDFCEARMLFLVIVIGELLAFLLVLTPSFSSASGSHWNDLAMISLFIQWVALSSLAVLCVCRRWLRRLDNVAAGVVSYAIILGVTLALSEAVYWLFRSRLLEVELHAAMRSVGEPLWFAQRSLEQHRAWHIEFLLRNLGISAIVAALALRYLYVQFQWRLNLERQAEARIQALQSRIRPHFLFNSMNTIASFTRTQPALAEQVVEDLADLFRASLGDARVPVTLERELEVCREYLRIEQLRLGERLVTEWDVDGLPSNALIPALSLQPLLENAVYHGIEPAPDGGMIRVIGQAYGEKLAVTVSNTLAAPGASARSGNQMAQDNVRQRLEAFFGEAGELRVSEAGGHYNVCVVFPYRRPDA